MCEWIGSEEAGDPVRDGRPVGQPFIESWEGRADIPDRILLHALPELLEPGQAILDWVSGDEARVDGADRCANDPVGLDASLVQRLIDAGLVRAERAAALKHQHDLAWEIFSQRFQR